MATVCNQYELKTLNEKPTCFKNYTNPSCIDLYVTNCPKSFQSTLTIEMGLSDFHKLIVTILKVKHEKFHLKLYIIEAIKILTRANFLRNYN